MVFTHQFGVGFAPSSVLVHSVGHIGFVQIKIAVGHRIRQLMEWCEVINHPKTPSVGGGNQIIVPYMEISNGGDGQIQLERGPIFSIIKRNIHAPFGPCVQQAFANLVGTDGPGVIVVLDAIGDQGPSFSVIIRFVEVRGVIAKFIRSGCHINGTRVKRACVDAVDHIQFGRHGLRRGHIFPSCTIIAGHMNQAIITSGPNHSFLQYGFCNYKNVGIKLSPRIVLGDGSSRGHDGFWNAPCQFWGNGFPGLSAVRSGVQIIGTCV